MLYKGECHSDSLAMQAGTGVPSAAASVQQELTITGCAEPRPPLLVHTCEQTDTTDEAAEDVTIDDKQL